MGKVYLVGAGPGDPELLTLKAARILAQADVVLHDGLVSGEVLAMARAGAELIEVGKRCGRGGWTQEEINRELIRWAGSREVVVRLKGGDPSLFARGGEELEALRNAGIEFEVVPGITAALGAAAAAGISLTDRRAVSQVLLSTFSREPGRGAVDWGILTPETTLVIYMPGRDYGEISRRLKEAGLPADLPCVIFSSVSTPEQEARWTSVGRLGREEALPAPAILIVGRLAVSHLPKAGAELRRRMEELQAEERVCAI